jgi:hypothetical protein
MDYFNLIREKRRELSLLESELKNRKESLNKEIEDLKVKHLAQLRNENSIQIKLLEKYLTDTSKNVYLQDVPIYQYRRGKDDMKYMKRHVKVISYFNPLTSKLGALDYVTRQYAVISWNDKYVPTISFKQISIDKIDGNSIQKIKNDIFGNSISKSVKTRELEKIFNRIQQLLEFSAPSITQEAQKDLIAYELSPYLSERLRLHNLSAKFNL